MALPLLAYVIGTVVVGGIAAIAMGGGYSGGSVMELGPKQGNVQLKPPLALLVYQNSETGNAARKAFGEAAKGYSDAQAMAVSLSALLGMDAEQGGILSGEIKEAFGGNMAATVTILPAPGDQIQVEDFMEGVSPADLARVMAEIFQYVSNAEQTVSAVEVETITPLEVFRVRL